MPEKPKQYRPAGRPPPRPRETRPNSTARGYDAAWQRFRLSYLADHPLCLDCQARGRTVEAKEIDHVTPMGRGGGKFDPANLRPLCKSCHSRKTARCDRTG